MPTYTIDGPDGKSYSIDGPEGATRDQVIAKIKEKQGSTVGAIAKKAIEPLTRYPETEARFAQEGYAQMGRGAEQIGAGEYGKGAANLGLGALNYTTAPITAGLHTVVGEPVHEATGSEFLGDVAETAAGFALPMPKGLPRGTGAAEKAAPTIDELYAAGDKAFRSPEIRDLKIRTPAVKSWAAGMQTRLTEMGLDGTIAPKVWAALGKLESSPTGPGSMITGNNLQSLRHYFGEAARGADASEAKAATEAINALDEFIPKIPHEQVISGDPFRASQVWQEARGNWAAAKRADTMAWQSYKADLQAGGTYSGTNTDNALRQKVKEILFNPQKRKGFSDEEIKAMEKIVNGTFTGNAVRYLGGLLGGGGGVGAAIASGAGAMVGAGAHGAEGAGIGAVALPAAGAGLRLIGGKLTAKSVAELDEAIRSRSPLAGYKESVTQGWQQAAKEYETAKTPQAMARLVIASHALLTVLTGEGETDEKKAAEQAFRGDASPLAHPLQ